VHYAAHVPTVRDRVIQTAAKLVLEPIFEADFEDNAYGYRPARGAVDAVKEVHRHISRGYTDVVDADVSRYFDSIPRDELLKSVARRIVDRHVLRLIKLWLKAPIEERDEGDGTPAPDCPSSLNTIVLGGIAGRPGNADAAVPFAPAVLGRGRSPAGTTAPGGPRNPAAPTACA
jgi:hypothetical protein